MGLPRFGTAPNLYKGFFRACKAALARLVAGRPNSNFLDFRVDDPVTRDQKNFLDPIHYRAPVARLMEQRIAESLRVGNGGRPTF